MKIYTKTGDTGTTAHLNGRTNKDSRLMHCVGELDELNASLALVLINELPSAVDKKIKVLQSHIFHLGAYLVEPETKSAAEYKVQVEEWVKLLENDIDSTSLELPVLQNFILPGGSAAASHLHLSRAICRRAERNLVSYKSSLESADSEYTSLVATINIYINRLSDWLFTYARLVNAEQAVLDTIWKPGENNTW